MTTSQGQAQGMEYTPEPWVARGKDVLHTETFVTVVARTDVGGASAAEQKANAERIAACVNFCKRFPTGALADGGLVKIVEALKRIAVPAHSIDEDDADGWCQLASDRREIARAALRRLSPEKE